VTDERDAEVEKLRAENTRLAEAVASANWDTLQERERAERAEGLLRRIRQWDMLVGYVNADREQVECTGDAPFWRSEIDKVLRYDEAQK
jgi:hypothetical protein